MMRLCHVASKDGRPAGLLAMYILHSLKKRPQSGYGILAGIREKCGGNWAPSKGTIYPLLAQLESDGLISLKTVGKRSKKVFQITPEGRAVLSRMRRHGKDMDERLDTLRGLFSEMLGEEKAGVFNLLFDIRQASIDKSGRNGRKVVAALERCKKNLEEID
ncbi:MAG: PadR family transcriptional regulator [Candidatus Altiarchaeota archaeon]|nr:PadR family transcriptional regulator [Candidatus Altiarchaeota archaeon]